MPLALFQVLEQNEIMSDERASAISRTKCRDIMTRNVRTVDPSASLVQVAAMMRDSDVGAVPVVDGVKLVGILTDRDIVIRSVAEGSASAAAAGDIMTKELYTVAPDDFVFEAVRLMGDKQIRRIPVVGADGTLEGIIAMADVALEMEDEREIAETLEEISSGTAYWSKQ